MLRQPLPPIDGLGHTLIIFIFPPVGARLRRTWKAMIPAFAPVAAIYSSISAPMWAEYVADSTMTAPAARPCSSPMQPLYNPWMLSDIDHRLCLPDFLVDPISPSLSRVRLPIHV